MDRRRLSSAFCPNSLDTVSVESVGMNWKDWPENLEDKNHFFLTAQHFTICFTIAYTGAVTLGRNTLVLCLYRCLTVVRNIPPGSRTGTRETSVSPRGLNLGAILEGYSDCTPGGIRGKQGFNGEELDTSLGCHQVYLWCISTPPQWENREGQLRSLR